MSNKPKKRLCWNCEASVAIGEEHCPYCSVYLAPVGKDNQYSLFTPPYKVEEEENAKEADVPPAPYAQAKTIAQSEHSPSITIPEQNSGSSGVVSLLIPLSLMILGSAFFLFGLGMLFFSREGIFTLQWDGTLWYIYFTLGIPMLIFGYAYLLKLPDDQS